MLCYLFTSLREKELLIPTIILLYLTLEVFPTTYPNKFIFKQYLTILLLFEFIS